jgi:hypothetical protein
MGGLMGYSMRTERYRFTQWVHRHDHAKVEALELYDHRTDPQENENLAGRPEHADLIRSLTEQARGGWKAAVPGNGTGGSGR